MGKCVSVRNKNKLTIENINKFDIIIYMKEDKFINLIMNKDNEIYENYFSYDNIINDIEKYSKYNCQQIFDKIIKAIRKGKYKVYEYNNKIYCEITIKHKKINFILVKPNEEYYKYIDTLKGTKLRKTLNIVIQNNNFDIKKLNLCQELQHKKDKIFSIIKLNDERFGSIGDDKSINIYKKENGSYNLDLTIKINECEQNFYSFIQLKNGKLIYSNSSEIFLNDMKENNELKIKVYLDNKKIYKISELYDNSIAILLENSIIIYKNEVEFIEIKRIEEKEGIIYYNFLEVEPGLLAITKREENHNQYILRQDNAIQEFNEINEYICKDFTTFTYSPFNYYLQFYNYKYKIFKKKINIDKIDFYYGNNLCMINNNVLAVGSYNKLFLIDVENNKIISEILNEFEFNCFIYKFLDNTILIGDSKGSLSHWEINNENELEIINHKEKLHDKEITGIIMMNKDTLITSSYDNKIKIWEMEKK
jgi:WD40 repeat protein